LWLNSALGLILMLSYRVPTEGPWIQFKKPSLNIVPVVNPTTLKPPQKAVLVKAYDSLCGEKLRPLSEMREDPVRVQIDAAVEKALGFPALGFVRDMLAVEPIISAKPLY